MMAVFEALRARVKKPATAPPAVAAGGESSPRRRVPSVAEQVDAELSRRERVAAERTARARLTRISAGGPCGYCGIPFSSVLSDVRSEDGVVSEEQPFWRPGLLGPSCVDCQVDRDPLVLSGASSPIDDLSHRGYVASRMLGLERWWVPRKLGERLSGVFLWWAETDPRPAAPPSPADRFGWVDVDRLRAAIDANLPRQPFSDGPPCGRCGKTDEWLYVAGGVRAVPNPIVLSSSSAPTAGWYKPSRNVEVEPTYRCSCGAWAPQLPYHMNPSQLADVSLAPWKLRADAGQL